MYCVHTDARIYTVAEFLWAGGLVPFAYRGSWFFMFSLMFVGSLFCVLKYRFLLLGSRFLKCGSSFLDVGSWLLVRGS